MLLSISTIHHINHAFGITVTKIAVMWRTKMNLETTLNLSAWLWLLFAVLYYHCFINGVACFIRENASRKARHHFFDTKFMAQTQNRVVHLHIVSKKVQVGTHIVEKATNLVVKLLVHEYYMH